jgi:hypothetical protein
MAYSPDNLLDDSVNYARQAEKTLLVSHDLTHNDIIRDRAVAEAQVWATLSMSAAVRELIEVYVAATAGH